MTINDALIQEITLNQSAASVTLNVPSGYTDLKLLISARGSDSNIYTEGKLRFNGASTDANMSMRNILGSGSGVSSGNSATGYIGVCATGNTATANTYGNTEVYIPNYASANPKSFSADAVMENNATGSYIVMTADLWNSTAAITSIEIIPLAGSWMAGSTFTLYGISALGTTPTQTPKATGGDIIKNDGTYWIHTFLSTGAFIPQTSLTCDYLLVGGGGGNDGGVSGSTYASGGAGGIVTQGSSLSLTGNAIYTAVVGAGAAYQATNAQNGYAGSTSSLTGTGVSLTATGGGGGRVNVGGGNNASYTGGAISSAISSGGGGAGAGGNGGNGVDTNTGGAGGAGVTATILGTVIAGGGSGGANTNSGTTTGGGGRGYPQNVAPTQYGAGGGGNTTSIGAGYQGVVIIRYPMA